MISPTVRALVAASPGQRLRLAVVQRRTSDVVEHYTLNMMPRKRIKLLHPGYETSEILLMLPAHDGADLDSVPYTVVHTAGAIIANNRFDGWLSTSPSGEPRVEHTVGLLHAGDYYFHLHSDDEPYPVVPNFRNWRFPHEAGLPEGWQEIGEHDDSGEGGRGQYSQISEPCRITGRQLALQTAHIIPASEKQWFGANRMDQYGDLANRSGDSVADTAANCMRLTCDAHILWDAGNFTVVPKVCSTSTLATEGRAGAVSGTTRWYTHALVEHEELYKYWHNLPLALPLRAPEFIFARFAWDIFPRLQGFLHSGPPRRLAVYDSELDKFEVRMYKHAERRIFTLDQGRGRSASPTKRQRSTQSADHADGEAGHAQHGHRGESKQRIGRASWNYADSSQDSAIALPQCCRDINGLDTANPSTGQCNWDTSLSAAERHKRPSRSPDSTRFDDDCHRGRKRRRSQHHF